ncbi:thermonuclease family protein [Rhizobium multihospitium]|uniref:Endonuclease YncB, thermonuclease family n=1 Tax=Rhizobium multihospitium TaxID=410764 RepID=A0A1C3XD03_9HYPH|nr:thermonuclease family protein [Rhizobium multihospitium]SCB50170.1 Endonuclease YncB, thermonuclease family [Rhizobium multihospitium]
MMRPREVGSLAVIGVVACAAVPCLAQSGADPASLYQPRVAAQLPPLRVEVIDGVRFRDIETKTVFRLYGIDACAPEQTANLGRQPWPCGTMVQAWLVTATLNTWVACTVISDQPGEHLARCATAGHRDLAADMLREGVAVLAPVAEGGPVIREYAAAEEAARKAYRGLWSSTFQMPWEWRTAHEATASTVARAGATP